MGHLEARLLVRQIRSLVKRTQDSIVFSFQFIIFHSQDHFRNGNVVQLVSRKSGRCVEIVMSPQGQLVVDALGTEGPQVYHGKYLR